MTLRALSVFNGHASDDGSLLLKVLAVSNLERKGVEMPQGHQTIQTQTRHNLGMKLRDHALEERQ